MDRLETHRRMSDALLIFAEGHRPIVEEKMRVQYGGGWAEQASTARGASAASPLDGYALCKTTLDRWIAGTKFSVLAWGRRRET